MEAADYAIARAEETVDRAIGKRARTIVERCGCAAILGAPLAWFLAGRHWNGIAIAGLTLGVALFATIDAIRAAIRRR
jgi:hypothetical protein